MLAQGRTAYFKTNGGWPVRAGNRGWRRLTLVERYDAGVRHFLRTPKGSIWSRPDYGTDLEIIRTQAMNMDLVEVVKASMQQGFTKYFPDLVLQDLQSKADQEQDLLEISAIWYLKGGTALVQIGAARQQKSTVLI